MTRMKDDGRFSGLLGLNRGLERPVLLSFNGFGRSMIAPIAGRSMELFLAGCEIQFNGGSEEETKIF